LSIKGIYVLALLLLLLDEKSKFYGEKLLLPNVLLDSWLLSNKAGPLVLDYNLSLIILSLKIIGLEFNVIDIIIE
jgi:hypothetical protein